MPYPRSNGD